MPDMFVGAALFDLARDFRFAVRLLIKAPGFAALACLTLALAIGANTAIFSVVNALLLRPLPYPQADRLVFLDGVFSRPEGDSSFQLSYPELADLAEQSTTLTGVASYNNAWGLALEGREGAARLPANFVGLGYFEVLGAHPLAGRTFVADDHIIGDDGRMVAILNESAWRQHFGGDVSIVGRDVRLQNRLFTIVGVMPDSFQDVALAQQERVDVWVPIERGPALFGGLDVRNRNSRLLWGVARVAAGVTADQASAELRAISARLTAEHPLTNTAFILRAAPLSEQFFEDARRPLWLLLGGSIFVLLIGCANVANLLLVRSTARTREIAVRLAIGASRSRVVRQLLAESVVLAMIGSLGGLLLAAWLTPALVAVSGLTIPSSAGVTIDVTVLAVTLGTALGCGVLFGLAPIWRASRLSTRDAVAVSGSINIARRSSTALWLAGIEVTAAFVLAAGALLMVKSLSALTSTDLLFRHDNLLTVRLELPQDRYGTPQSRARFGDAAHDRLSQLPGVEHVVLWGPSMFARSTWISFIAPEEQLPDDNARLMVWRHSTNPGALRNLGIALRGGRDLTSTDTLDTPLVAVVSETTAARLWPGQDAVGRRFRSGSGPTASMITVVGVAADARHRGRFRFSLGAEAHVPQLDIYLPFSQRPNGLVTLGIRTRTNPADSSRAVANAIASIDPTLALYDIAPLEQRMRTEESSVQFAALLMNLYAGLALLLAAIGVYGVLASGVSTRLRELAIRSALGADPRHLVLGVLRDGVIVTTAAVGIGALVTWMLGRSWQALLFDVSATDPWLLSIAAVLLVAVSAAASLVPARRAARVDPLTVLRGE